MRNKCNTEKESCLSYHEAVHGAETGLFQHCSWYSILSKQISFCEIPVNTILFCLLKLTEWFLSGIFNIVWCQNLDVFSTWSM